MDFYPKKERYAYGFWMGDLNYRVCGIDISEMVAACRTGHFGEILHHFDQLTQEKEQGQVRTPYKGAILMVTLGVVI